MAISLSYEAIKEMKFADYKKAFKEKSQWKKAKALVVLIDYKLGSRKTPVVLPLRRANQLKPLLKQIKKDKHPSPKLAGGLLSMGKGQKGPELTFKMMQGGYPIEALESKLTPVIKQLLKCEFVVERGSEAEAATDGESPEKTTASTEEALQSRAKNEQAPSDTPQEENNSVVPNVARSIKEIKRLAIQVRKEVVPHLQQKTFGEAQAKLISQLESALDTFKTLFETTPAAQQKQLVKHQKQIEQKIRPMLDKIQQVVAKLSSTSDNSASDANSTVLKEQKKALTTLFKQAKQALTQEGKAVVERFKKNNNVFADANVLQGVQDKIEAFLTQYKTADPSLQEQLAPAQEKLKKQQETLKRVDEKLDEVELEPQSPEEVDEALTNLEKRIQFLKEKLAQQQSQQ